MSPSHALAATRLLTALARKAAWRASDLAAEARVSVPTLHRMLQQLGSRVVAAGKARRARYALRRAVRGDPRDFSLYAVDEAGSAAHIATLISVSPEGSWMPLPASAWPLSEEARDGWWPGLPYPFNDMRPQGYMGRQFALQQHQQLAVPLNPEEWSDDDVLYVLSQRGSDVSGNLILGQDAYERWLHSKLAPPVPINEAEIGATYADLAAQAVSIGVAGSSAAGEFPKFAASRELQGMATPHVLVKFSGADDSTAVRRWADLLVCEHLALESVRLMPGIEGTKSRILHYAGRTFLELERFDRHGQFGRSSLCSLSALNAALLGDASTDWIKLGERLGAIGLLSPDDIGRISRMTWFGRLIGNTDMHLGNLSFRPGQTLSVAPVYDMLPMLYAPLAGGEVPVRAFGQPLPLPLPQQRTDWRFACAAATAFWGRASQDVRISQAFHEVCAANRQQLQVWAQLV
jgi:hypothetical protein